MEVFIQNRACVHKLFVKRSDILTMLRRDLEFLREYYILPRYNTFNPLSLHDILKYHFASLKNGIIF